MSQPEALIISVSNKAAGVGVITVGAGWITSQLVLGICGIILAAIGVGIGWYYKHKEDKRKAQAHDLMIEWYKHHTYENNIPRL